MRKNRGLVTYGRHRSRVIVADVWSSEEKKRNVFSTSSELDSSKQSSIFHSSGSENGSLSLHSDSSGLFMSSSTRNANKRTNKTGSKEEDKENVPQMRRRQKKQQQSQKVSAWNVTESGSDCSMASEKNCKPKTLRERKKNIDYNDSANLKKQLKGTAAKRKRVARASTVTFPKNISLNFSDFDDYSFVISDNSVNNLKNDKDAIETSTPVAKRTRHQHDTFEDINESDLSDIEIVDSPKSDVYYSAVDTHNSILVSNNMASPSLVSSVAGSKDLCCSTDMKCTPESAIVRVERMTDSFIQSHSSGPKIQQPVYNTRNSSREIIDLSTSLFSTPGSKPKQNSLHLLTEMMKNISFRRKQNVSTDRDNSDRDIDSVEEVEGESAGEVSEEDYEVSEDKEESTEEESDGEHSKHGDLSDIEEVEDESEDENESGISLDNSHRNGSSLEDQLSGSYCDTINKKAVVNLQRLSESLISDHVSSREGRRRGRPNQFSIELNEEDENSADLFTTRQSDSSNCTLYMLADSNNTSSRSSCSSQYLSDNSKIISEADDSEDATEVEDEPSGSLKLKTPRKITLRNRNVESLQNSFTEMLTPIKRPGSLVPLSAQTKVLLLCEQSQPISFSEALPGRMLSLCKKIGEGVYGEVFRSNHDNQSVAIKIIPIEGDFPVNDEPQKKYSEILPEVVIAKELSNLRDAAESTSSFCEVMSVSLVHGKYPVQLIKQWDIFHKTKHSENDRPDMFPESQLYVLFEFADCGRDLESYQFDSMDQAKSVLSQVTFALAVAEHNLQFEHRDLHWGNILIRPTDQEEICFKLMGKLFRVPTMGVEANIIDFTLSRLQKDCVTVFSDLSTDESMFEGEGDLQFQVYRDMREENSNNWEPFHPFTNVLWLHYVADKLVYGKRYPAQTSRQGREILRQFRQFLSGILEYESACDMALSDRFLNS